VVHHQIKNQKCRKWYVYQLNHQLMVQLAQLIQWMQSNKTLIICTLIRNKTAQMNYRKENIKDHNLALSTFPIRVK
jgi:uncharacterized CHY-type Zn-finger protein